MKHDAEGTDIVSRIHEGVGLEKEEAAECGR